MTTLSPPRTPLFELRDVCKNYGSMRRAGAAPRIQALEGVTLTIGTGEFLACIGPSGGGKSTFLNLLGGLDMPSSGEIRFQNQPLQRRQLVAFRRRSVGFVFQMFHLLPYRTALDNVALGLTMTGASWHHARREARLWLERLGLSARAHQYPPVLSGGEKQRVAIARAMVKHPPVLLADEPTGSLDKDHRREVLETLRRLHQDNGTTVILVTHNEEDARQYAERVLRIDGKILAD